MYSFIYTAEINVHYVCKGIWISSLIPVHMTASFVFFYFCKVFLTFYGYQKFLLLTYNNVNWLLHASELNSHMSVEYNHTQQQ